jgi:hypothetical protein
MTRTPVRRISRRSDRGQRSTQILEHIQRLREIARSLPSDAPQRSRLLAEAKRCIALVGPVPVSAAASMLSLTTPTVRSWIKEGLLLPADSGTPARLEPGQLLRVAELVTELRESGHDRKLLDAVWYRLADRTLLESDDLQESLDQMRRGEGKQVRPKPEEPR